MIGKLLEIFSNYTRSLEILYLLEDIKKAVRLDANEVELKNIKEFCEINDLCLEISDFKIIKITDEGKGKFSNKSKVVSLNYPGQGVYHLYISKDKNIAKMLKLMEKKNDDNAIGEILGYPKCCIDFFANNKEAQLKLQNDYILPALKNSRNFEFSFYLNYAIRYFDVTLLSHFPHSFDCKHSIKIAKRNLECIKKHSDGVAKKFENTLKSAVLYTENQGVFMLKDCNLNNDILEFKDVLSTVKNDLFNMLDKNKAIKIINKNKIEIAGKTLEDIGFFIFT